VGLFNLLKELSFDEIWIFIILMSFVCEIILFFYKAEKSLSCSRGTPLTDLAGMKKKSELCAVYRKWVNGKESFFFK
jgi:hypothetical protein